MRKLILSMMTSLDGHVARADGSLDWFLSDAQFEAEMLGLLGSVDAMLFGRVSYELLAQFWPNAGKPASDEAPGGFTNHARQIEFARLMNSIPKIVYSRTLAAANWGPARWFERSMPRRSHGRSVSQAGIWFCSPAARSLSRSRSST